MFKAVPVCAGCGSWSGITVSCSKCCKICCIACLNGSELLCRKCQNEPSDVSTTAGKTERPGQSVAASVTGSSPLQSDLCPIHSKLYSIYCYNCNETICGTCVEPEQPHDSHYICSLNVVYRESVAKIEANLTAAGKLHAELQTHTAKYRRNLELLEKELSGGLGRIDALAESSRIHMSRSLTARKKSVEEKMEIPVLYGAVLENFRRKTDRLSKKEFMQQFAELSVESNELTKIPMDLELQEVGDVGCELISPYQLEEMIYEGFSEAEIDKRVSFSLETIYGVLWDCHVTKANMLQIEPIPNDEAIFQFIHELVVIIDHPDYSQSIRKVFQLDKANGSIFDVEEVTRIVDHGYCSKDGDLIICIGIRPANALIEKQLLKHLLEKMASKIEEYDDEYSIQRYQIMSNGFGKDNIVKCPTIYDVNSCSWSFGIKKYSRSSLGVYIQSSNYSATCRAFMEIKYNNNKAIIQRCSLQYFGRTDYGKILHRFDKLDDLDNEDMLLLRYGVRALPDAPS